MPCPPRPTTPAGPHARQRPRPACSPPPEVADDALDGVLGPAPHLLGEAAVVDLEGLGVALEELSRLPAGGGVELLVDVPEPGGQQPLLHPRPQRRRPPRKGRVRAGRLRGARSRSLRPSGSRRQLALLAPVALLLFPPPPPAQRPRRLPQLRRTGLRARPGPLSRHVWGHREGRQGGPGAPPGPRRPGSGPAERWYLRPGAARSAAAPRCRPAAAPRPASARARRPGPPAAAAAAASPRGPAEGGGPVTSPAPRDRPAAAPRAYPLPAGPGPRGRRGAPAEPGRGPGPPPRRSTPPPRTWPGGRGTRPGRERRTALRSGRGTAPVPTCGPPGYGRAGPRAAPAAPAETAPPGGREAEQRGSPRPPPGSPLPPPGSPPPVPPGPAPAAPRAAPAPLCRCPGPGPAARGTEPAAGAARRAAGRGRCRRAARGGALPLPRARRATALRRAGAGKGGRAGPGRAPRGRALGGWRPGRAGAAGWVGSDRAGPRRAAPRRGGGGIGLGWAGVGPCWEQGPVSEGAGPGAAGLGRGWGRAGAGTRKKGFGVAGLRGRRRRRPPRCGSPGRDRQGPAGGRNRAGWGPRPVEPRGREGLGLRWTGLGAQGRAGPSQLVSGKGPGPGLMRNWGVSAWWGRSGGGRERGRRGSAGPTWALGTAGVEGPSLQVGGAQQPTGTEAGAGALTGARPERGWGRRGGGDSGV